jgi:hypothetical protein
MRLNEYMIIANHLVLSVYKPKTKTKNKTEKTNKTRQYCTYFFWLLFYTFSGFKRPLFNNDWINYNIKI